MLQITEGSHAVAEAVKLCRPQVVSAYPITPQTHIVERLAEMVADGDLNGEYICVESEFSALSSCVGASAAGSRVYSATTSQGLAFMAEVVFNAAGMRLPIVMTIANRALGAPLNIWNDQQDSIFLRDSGWMQIYGEDAQEAMDLHFIAYKLAERHDVLLPCFVCLDGFIVSHTFEPVDIPSQKEIDEFLPAFNPLHRLDAKNPMSFGMYATPDCYQEFRYEINAAMTRAKAAYCEIAAEFKAKFGRDYTGLVEGYRLEDAETAIVAMGSICGTAKDAIDEMRDAGEKVGLLKIRSFRPFPSEEVRTALKGVKNIAVIEKNISIGSRMLGAVGLEVKDAVYKDSPNIFSYVGGLGGRDIRKRDIKQIVQWAKQGRNDCFFGLREELLK